MLLNAGLIASGAASGTLWTPAEITTALWLDADDAATITESSGAVSQWDDKSGNAVNYSSSGTNQPTLISSALNGKSGIRFDGSNDYLSESSNQFGLTERSFFIVVKENSAVGNAGWFSIRSASGRDWSSLDGFIYGSSNRSSNRVFFGSSSSFGGAGYLLLETTTPGTIIPASIYSEVGNASSGTLYIDGSSVTTDSSFSAFNAVSGGGSSLGSRNDTGINQSPYFNGDIYELIYIESALSLTDRQKVEGYLAHKWGLTANLPGGHPYKTTAPTV